MKRGKVAEAHDGSRVPPDGVVVDPIENPHRAIAATREEEGVEVIRAEKAVDLRDSLSIAPGQITALRVVDVPGQRHAEPTRLELALRLVDPSHLRRG